MRAAYAVTRRQTLAEDAVQDGFERAFTALGTFDAERSFGAWLRRIVVNRAIDLIRAERRLVQLDEESASDDAAGLPSPDDRVLRAIDALHEDQRTVVLLRYGLDLTHAEIAQTLDLPVGTVKSRLARALASLRARLEVHP